MRSLFVPSPPTDLFRSQHFCVFSNPSSLTVGNCALPHIPGASQNLLFPRLNLHSSRARRHPGRLPSSRCIESAPEHLAPLIILLSMRASDTTLGLNGARARKSRLWLTLW